MTSELKEELLTVGAGCYWGTEAKYTQHFAKQHPGAILGVKVGFMGGRVALQPDDPAAYRTVCSGQSGHVEVAQVRFDPGVCSYADLLRFFFSFHDPTTPNRQGNDKGTQYASVIFFHSEEQKATAERITRALDAKLAANAISFIGGSFNKFEGSKVYTELRAAGEFIPAHAAHQAYLEANPGGYCNHRIRFDHREL